MKGIVFVIVIVYVIIASKRQFQSTKPSRFRRNHRTNDKMVFIEEFSASMEDDFESVMKVKDQGFYLRQILDVQDSIIFCEI